MDQETKIGYKAVDVYKGNFISWYWMATTCALNAIRRF
jgi:hypothetical protein